MLSNISMSTFLSMNLPLTFEFVNFTFASSISKSETVEFEISISAVLKRFSSYWLFELISVTLEFMILKTLKLYTPFSTPDVA